MLLSERMALRTAISHYQHNVSLVLELSSNPWKCFRNRAEIKRLNVLLKRDAETISAVLTGVKYEDIERRDSAPCATCTRILEGS